MRKFRFHWLDGRKETREGIDVSDAFRSLGYEGVALRGLHCWEMLDESKPVVKLDLYERKTQ